MKHLEWVSCSTCTVHACILWLSITPCVEGPSSDGRLHAKQLQYHCGVDFVAPAGISVHATPFGFYYWLSTTRNDSYV